MIPVFLDPCSARIALVGNGGPALRRLQWLREAGAEPDLWSPSPSDELAAAAGAGLARRLPMRAEIACYHVVWIADLAAEEAEALATLARRTRVLVNVEDMPAHCAFHTPAVVRRGRLTLAAGTGGASPAVARAARERLEQAFPPQWGQALEEIAEARKTLRAQQVDFETLMADARARLAKRDLV